jgi:hypothetical protein
MLQRLQGVEQLSASSQRSIERTDAIGVIVLARDNVTARCSKTLNLNT